MPVLDGVPQAVVISVAIYLSWLLLRPFIGKSPLDNIPGPPSDSFFRGNLPKLLGRQPWKYREELVQQYGRVFTVPGLFGSKWVVVHDPKAMHSIFIKDAEAYPEPLHTMRMMLGPGLLSVGGTQHKRQRKMLNPVFSTKHLREMMPLFYSVISRTRDALDARVSDTPTVELDLLSWMGRTTLEVLGQAGLGYSFDPLTEDRPDEFATAVKDFFPQLIKCVLPRMLLPYVSWIGTPSFQRRVVEALPSQNVQRLREISDVMHARSVQIFEEKRAALARGDDAMHQQVGEGRDVMSILLRENLLASEEDKLPDDELIAQVSTMVLAGMDTTANTLARILELLATHPDVQEKLRAEIVQAAENAGGAPDFDTLMGLPYLEAVCRETFRAFPGVTVLFRDTGVDTVLPLSEPMRLRDGTLADAVPLPRGTRVMVEVPSSNRDRALWGADADAWRPERWLAPLPREVEEARIPGVYAHLMTFIGGSKACIGFKFAQIEAKTVLFVLLQHFRFELTDKTIKWNMAGVVYPSVELGEPELPLKVSLLHS